jgi:hypothetical protein
MRLFVDRAIRDDRASHPVRGGGAMTSETVPRPPVREPGQAAALRIGAGCGIVGGLAFAALRTLHGDTPAADPQASLAFVTERPWYAGVHIGALLAATLSLAMLTALAGSLTHPTGQLLGRWGLATAVVGLGAFAVESTSEGLALPELARALAGASPEQRIELVRLAHAVGAATHGPSLAAIAVLYGIALMAFGLALVVDDYPSWLGWAGLAVGAVTLVAATGEYLNPDLVPGFLIYGLLASILAQAWLVALATTMLRRARSHPGRPAWSPTASSS